MNHPHPRLYSMEWEPHKHCLYFVLNGTLRTKDRQKLKPWLLYLRLILNAFSRLPSQGCHVYRGVQISLSENYQKGNQFVWWTFSSCTIRIDILQSEQFLGRTVERTLFSIECLSGKDIHLYSYYGNEDEILLLPTRQFEVIGFLDQSHGLHIIQLREIQPPFPLIESTPLEKILL